MKANSHTILKRPVITEDCVRMAAMTEPQYIFLVDIHANKIEIARAVEEVFGVRVKAVNTLRQEGKMRTMRRHTGKRAETKKAFVTLHKDQTIPIF